MWDCPTGRVLAYTICKLRCSGGTTAAMPTSSLSEWEHLADCLLYCRSHHSVLIRRTSWGHHTTTAAEPRRQCPLRRIRGSGLSYSLTTQQASLHATNGSVAPTAVAFDAGLRPGPFPDRAASLLPGLLTTTRTGLSPAGDDEPPIRSCSLDHHLLMRWARVSLV
jgi:hypothetical protein